MRGIAVCLALSLACVAQAHAQNPSSGNVPAPDFEGVTEWINSEPLKLADLRGKVVLVHFWTFGCINCIHDHDKYLAWEKKYANNKNFVIIGIHTPETKAEHDINNVRAKVKEIGYQQPVAVDNDAKLWKAWNNRLWPSMCLIDKEGNTRYAWEGELAWQGQKGPQIMEEKLKELLKEKAPARRVAKAKP